MDSALGGSFVASAVLFGSSVDECSQLLESCLQERDCELVQLEEMRCEAPLSIIPNFDFSAFSFEQSKLVYISGRAFFDGGAE